MPSPPQPHAEERPTGASRRTRILDPAGLLYDWRPFGRDCGDVMLELNPYYNRIKDLRERSAALRGYL